MTLVAFKTQGINEFNVDSDGLNFTFKKSNARRMRLFIYNIYKLTRHLFGFESSLAPTYPKIPVIKTFKRNRRK